MAYCKVCKKSYPDGLASCPHCDAAVDVHGATQHLEPEEVVELEAAEDATIDLGSAPAGAAKPAGSDSDAAWVELAAEEVTPLSDVQLAALAEAAPTSDVRLASHAEAGPTSDVQLVSPTEASPADEDEGVATLWAGSTPTMPVPPGHEMPSDVDLGAPPRETQSPPSDLRLVSEAMDERSAVNLGGPASPAEESAEPKSAEPAEVAESSAIDLGGTTPYIPGGSSGIDLAALGAGSSDAMLAEAAEGPPGHRPFDAEELALVDESSAVRLGDAPAATGDRPSGRDLIAEAVESGVDLAHAGPKPHAEATLSDQFPTDPLLGGEEDASSAVDLGAHPEGGSSSEAGQGKVHSNIDFEAAATAAEVDLHEPARAVADDEADLGATLADAERSTSGVKLGSAEREAAMEASGLDLADSERGMAEGDSGVAAVATADDDELGGAEPAETEEPAAKAATKPRRSTVPWLGGGIIGAVVGSGLCFAGLYFAGMVQMSGSTPAPNKGGSPVAAGMPGGEVGNAGTRPAGVPQPPPGTPEAMVSSGKGHLQHYLEARPEKAAPMNREDDEVKKAIADFTEAKSATGLFWLALIDELAQDDEAARKKYEQGIKDFKDKPEEARRFRAALQRMEHRPGKPMPAAAPGAGAARAPRLDPSGRELPTVVVLLLTALQEQPAGGAQPPAEGGKPAGGVEPPAPGNAEPEEPGFMFWEAMQNAKAGKYKEAIEALKVARDLHDKRRTTLSFLNSPNPNSDPLEEIFSRSCDQIEAYWSLQQTLKDKGYDTSSPAALQLTLEAKKKDSDALKAIAEKLKAEARPDDPKEQDKWLEGVAKNLDSALQGGTAGKVLETVAEKIKADKKPDDPKAQEEWLKGVVTQLDGVLLAKTKAEAAQKKLEEVVSKVKADDVKEVVDAITADKKVEADKDPDVVVEQLAAKLQAVAAQLKAAGITKPSPTAEPGPAVKELAGKLEAVAQVLKAPERKEFVEGLLKEKALDADKETAKAVEEVLGTLQAVVGKLTPRYLAADKKAQADVLKSVDRVVYLAGITDPKGTILALKDRMERVESEWRSPQDMLDVWLLLDPDGQLDVWPFSLQSPTRKAMVAKADRDAGLVMQDKDAKQEQKDKARFVRGLVRWNEGRYDEARAALQQALRDARPGEWRGSADRVLQALSSPANYYLPRAEQLRQAGQLAGALRVLNGGLAVFAKPGERGGLLAKRSQVHLDAAQLAQAADDAQKAIEAGAAAEGNFAAGRVAEVRGDWARAVQHYRSAVEAQPDADSRYRQALGRALLEQVSPTKPLPPADKAKLAPAERRATQADGESKVLASALKFNPAALLDILLGTTILMESGAPQPLDPRVKEAKDLAEKLIRAGDNEGYLIMARAMMLEGLWTQALLEYTKGVNLLSQESPPRIKPEYARALNELVRDHPAFQRPSALEPPEPFLAEQFYGAGLRRFFDRQYPQAEEQFNKAYEYYSQDARYLYFLGLSRLLQGKRDTAYDDFRLASQLEKQGKPSRTAVSQSLERIQGGPRQTVDQFRP